jgi:nucleotide-binding universal stress UspA family protein
MEARADAGRIVVGVDGSTESMAAFTWAIDEARRRDDAVEVVGTWTDPMAFGDKGLPIGVGKEIRDATKRAIDKAVSVATGNEDPGINIRPVVICGRAPRVLCEISEHADMLVLGSRGRGGFASLLLGSVSHQCAHHARCPLVIAHGRADSDGESGQQRAPRIVVGVDGSAGSYLAMEWAASEAQLRGATLDVVYAWHPLFDSYVALADEMRSGSQEVLAEAEKELSAIDSSLVTEGHVVEARTAPGLLQASRGADLLVVGSRGRGGFTGLLLGSVSQACITHATCPVAVIRAEEI